MGLINKTILIYHRTNLNPIKLTHFFIFFAVTAFPYAKSQYATEEDLRCFDFDRSCRECIQNPTCMWCSVGVQVRRLSGMSDLRHCVSRSSPSSRDCPAGNNEDPSNELNAQDDSTDPLLQLKPQKVKMKLRKEKPINITLTYKQIKDYPLDLYYLVDFSYSMNPYKENVAKVANSLKARMMALTSQFRLGFGTFVDKVISPYVDVHNLQRYKETPHSFMNRLKLTTDANLFTSTVSSIKISGNRDTPEGGLDALLQTIVCKDDIGWDESVRKVVVFCTDTFFHLAGDGKVAGIIEPNDGKCHMNASGSYTHGEIQDYPSVGQISELAETMGVNIIFAYASTSDEVRALYEEMTQVVKGSYSGPLDLGEGINELIEDVYKSITGAVEIEERTRHQDFLSINYYSRCQDSTAEVMRTNKCYNVTEDQTFDFEVEIRVTDCPENVHSTVLRIGTLQEYVDIEIEMLCECGCEQEGHGTRVPNSPECNGNGTFQCGVCSCNQGNYGNQCQCNRDGNTANSISEVSQCRPPDAEEGTPVCSGRGDCECGECVCNHVDFSGKYCQNNAAFCRQPRESSLCSGNGRCNQGKCSCNTGWEGRYCECRTPDSCVPQGQRKPCSGRGECLCGRCSCRRDNKVQYTGQYCEECTTCSAARCLEFSSCVLCDVWNKGDKKKGCAQNCSKVNLQEEINLDNKIAEGGRLCTLLDTDSGCDYNFTYKYLDKTQQYAVFAQTTQKCPHPINPLALALYAVVSVVAIGLATLVLWKILVTLHDHREYSKFLKEQKDGVFSNKNPLYESPTDEFTNPVASSDAKT